MGMMSYYWAEIQNPYLQSLGAKITGERWRSSLIWKFLDISLDVCNHRNHTLHYTDGPTKNYILTLITKKSPTTSVKSWQVFHKDANLYYTPPPKLSPFLPVCQNPSWLHATSNSIKCDQRREIRKKHLDVNSILIEWINRGRRIPSLTQLDEAHPLQTTIGSLQMINIFV